MYSDKELGRFISQYDIELTLNAGASFSVIHGKSNLVLDQDTLNKKILYGLDSTISRIVVWKEFEADTNFTFSSNMNLRYRMASENQLVYFQAPLDYNFDFSGKSIGVRLFNNGESGSSGRNLNIYMEPWRDSLILVRINAGNQESYALINPLNGKIFVDASGGEGGKGGQGDRGEDAKNYNTPVENRSSRNLGEVGGRGQDGGHGGHGGNVTVFYKPELAVYLPCLVIDVSGGQGGQGGRGGKGGCHQKVKGDDGLLDVLVPDRANYGQDGRDGNHGMPGNISYVEYH